MEHERGIWLLDQLKQSAALRESTLEVVEILVWVRSREETIAKRLTA
jgi:hypothetical protein